MLLARKRHVLAATQSTGSVPFDGLVSTANLISYWKLNESSGNRLDSVGTNHLTDNNTVPVVIGKIGNGASFSGSIPTIPTSNFLSCISNSSLQVNGTDFTITAWVQFGDGKSGSIIAKDNAADREYIIDRNDSSFRFFTNGGSPLISNTMTIVAGTWYFLVAWYDNTTKVVSLQVNNGVPAVSGPGSGPPIGNSLFRIGLGETNAIVDVATVIVDEVGFWKRVLTPAERAALYNSGKGLGYSPAPILTYQQQIVADGAVAYWPLDETSGTVANDKVGSRNGTISAGVLLNQAGVNGSKCMVFPNSGLGQIALPSFPSLAGSSTIELWAAPSTSGLIGVGNRFLLTRQIFTNGDFQIYVPVASERIRFLYFSGGNQIYDTDLTLTAGVMNHYVITQTTNQVILYVNGVAQTPALTWATDGDGGGPPGIGCTVDVPDWGWRGEMQDVAIYQRVLSPTEIANHNTLRRA